MKISEDDLKRLFDSDNDFSGPNDDWEGFDIEKDSEVKEIQSISEPVKVKKVDRKIENEITIKKVRKEIARVPKGSNGSHWGRFVDRFLKLLAFAGISGFLVFASLNVPAYFSQLKWLYYSEYLGERMPQDNSLTNQTYLATPKAVTPKTVTPQALTSKIPTANVNPTQPTPNLLADAQSILRIDTINVQTPVIWNVDEADIIKNLINGVAHYNGTSLPGQGGNVFIVGHSSNYPWVKSDYNHIFSLLDKLVNGDRISLNYAGKNFTYEVIEKKVVSANNVEVLNATNKEVLSLMTCWPVGTTLNRLLIISKLVQIS